MRPVPMLLAGALLVGCEEDPEPSALQLSAADFTPSAGMVFEYIPQGQGEAEPIWLQIRAEEWELRAGWDWDQAEVEGLWPVQTGGDLVVDGATALPATVTEQASFDNGRVTEIGPHEVYYGLFPEAVTVELSAGPLAGRVVFARAVGPIALQLGAYPWELASYDP